MTALTTAASNKSQTLINNSSSPGKISPGNPYQAPLVSSPFIDKISITLTLPNDIRQTVADNLAIALQHKAIFQAARGSSQFSVARNISLGNVPDRVLFQSRPRHSGIPDFRFEFNPSKIGGTGIDTLGLLLYEILPNGWEHVTAHGKVTRVDIAVDVTNLCMDHFLLMPNQSKWSRAWGSNGLLETLCLGHRTSNQVRVYNKTAEQKAKGNTIGANVVRVEKTLRNTNLSPAELDDIPNPFKYMVFAEAMPGPPPGETPERWSMFLCCVLVKGLTAALALLSVQRRTKYRKHLVNHKVPWWQPDLIWKDWPKAVSQLL